MSAIIIDGRKTGEKIREGVRQRAMILRETGVIPCLAVVLVGEDPASVSYVTAKENAIVEACMESRDFRLPASTTEEEILSLIGTLNKDKKIHGILVQLPLPGHISVEKVIDMIAPEKDVDGFNPVSVGNMMLEKQCFLPCTPSGVLALLREYEIPISGANVVIVGRSNIVGKPLANLFIRREYNATVTFCHTGTRDLGHHTSQADILVAAAGRPMLITPRMIKDGAVVIDVGVSRLADPSRPKGFRLCGDVDPAVAKKASFYTPVPGGVGPMTIAMLMQNIVEAAERSV